MEESQVTAFTPVLEGIKHVKTDDGEVLAKPFLDVCKQILPVIDKLGAAMGIVKSDIGGNISRLETKYNSDPTKFNYLYNMIKPEVETKTAKGSSSCTNGLLWLTRAMDFLMELFRNLIEHPDWSMSQCCTDSYSKTLKKWHGWIASSSFTVAMKLAPDRNKFMEVLGSGDVKGDIEKFLAGFSPLLEENHKFLVKGGSVSHSFCLCSEHLHSYLIVHIIRDLTSGKFLFFFVNVLRCGGRIGLYAGTKLKVTCLLYLPMFLVWHFTYIKCYRDGNSLKHNKTHPDPFCGVLCEY